MGKAPVATDEAIIGMRTDAQNKVDNGVPVIPRFPAWINQELIDAENAVTEEFSNVDMNLFNAYYDALKTPGNLRLESPGLTQEMYDELTKVLQAVITDESADVQALMDTAQENYQGMLDNQ